ncbi:MAG: oxygenase MpaB family protein [Propioniciclava sp.]
MVVRLVQRRLGNAVRSRVSGSDPDARGREIWGKPGERWFGPEDPIWQIHQDASMFVGGIAALLLQALHPLAMAGVAGHSGYRTDPWGRLRRTADYIAVTTYGTVPDATAVIAHINQVHHRVRGKDTRRRSYRASDPHLLRWVHAAEVWSFLQAYQAYGSSRLSAAEADRYVAQAAVPARLLGVIDPPESAGALEQVLASYRPELEAGPDAVETVRFLVRTPPLPWPARPGYWLLVAGALAVLPDDARALLRLRLPGPTPAAATVLGRTATAAVRWGLTGVESRRLPAE